MAKNPDPLSRALRRVINSTNISIRTTPSKEKMMGLRVLVLAILSFYACSFVQAQEDLPKLSWQSQQSGSDASLRGLWIVDQHVAWASGSGGTVLKTVDGETWRKVSVPGADQLDFRDIYAYDDQTAVIVNAGQPAVFYRTENGGKDWSKVYQHPHEKSFFDAIVAIDDNRLLAMSDPVDDRILLVESLDQGKTWKELPASRRPPKLDGEAGFAASGSNMIVDPRTQFVYLALGGHEPDQEAAESRILVSRDHAKTWQVLKVPMKRNPSSGIFSMTCLPSGACVAVGGNYLDPEDRSGHIALSTSENSSLFQVPENGTQGYRSGVTFTAVGDKIALIAVGPDGSDFSWDAGMNWKPLSDQGFHAVKSAADGTVWASGADGRIAKLNQTKN